MPPCLCRRNKETLAQRGSAEKRRVRRITAKETDRADAVATRQLAAHDRMEAISPCQ